MLLLLLLLSSSSSGGGFHVVFTRTYPTAGGPAKVAMCRTTDALEGRPTFKRFSVSLHARVYRYPPRRRDSNTCAKNTVDATRAKVRSSVRADDKFASCNAYNIYFVLNFVSILFHLYIILYIRVYIYIGIHDKKKRRWQLPRTICRFTYIHTQTYSYHIGTVCPRGTQK